MDFRLVEKSWDKELGAALASDRSRLSIICPFIKQGALTSLLAQHRVDSIEVITRFNLADFYQGVSDRDALRTLLELGARVRGIKNLHAKVFIFGKSRVFVTSANLTAAAFSRNHEFGFTSTDSNIIRETGTYFDRLWAIGGSDLVGSKIDEWDKKILSYLVKRGKPIRHTGLGDEGADAGFPPDPADEPQASTVPNQAFVKFLGTGDNRAPLGLETVSILKEEGCHWALCYPKTKRPRSVEDGAAMYIARLTHGPDIRIFGKATGLAHVPGRDEATPLEMEDHEWKRKWSNYIRVHDAQFVAGDLGNGVSLNELMEALGNDSFASTQGRLVERGGAPRPRSAYARKAAVRLTPSATRWLDQRLEKAFALHGKLAQESLDLVGWPADPLVSPNEPYAQKVDTVYQALVESARKGKRKVHYDPVMKLVGLDHHLAAHRNEIGKILAEVSRRSHRKKGVLLSVLVHGKTTGRPGTGFESIARELGFKWRDKDRFVQEQIDLVLKAF